MDAGDSAMVRLDTVLQNSHALVFMVWDSMKKKDTNDDPRQRFLKEMADLLHFWKEKLKGMTLLDAVRLASQ